MARTDCRPTAGLDEALAPRIARPKLRDDLISGHQAQERGEGIVATLALLEGKPAHPLKPEQVAVELVVWIPGSIRGPMVAEQVVILELRRRLMAYAGDAVPGGAAGVGDRIR